MEVGQKFLEKFICHLRDEFGCKVENKYPDRANLKERLSKELALHKHEYAKLNFSVEIVDTLASFVTKFVAFIVFRNKCQKRKKLGYCEFLKRSLTDMDLLHFTTFELSTTLHLNWNNLAEGMVHFVAQCSLRIACRGIKSYRLAIGSGYHIYRTSAVPNVSDGRFDILFDELVFKKFDQFVEESLDYLYQDFQSRSVIENNIAVDEDVHDGEGSIRCTSLALPLLISNEFGFVSQNEMDFATIVLQVTSLRLPDYLLKCHFKFVGVLSFAFAGQLYFKS
jgi:hypothetical protein